MIDDFSFNGWSTFLVYLVTAGLCFRNAGASLAALEVGRRKVALAHARRRFWIVLAALLLLLGLSRQLNLQALVAELARHLFAGDDAYGERDGLQLAIVIAIGVFGTLGLVVALVTFRRVERSILVAMAGAVAVVLLTTIRAISLRDIDRLLQQGQPHLRINNLIEIGALALICGACLLFDRRLHDEGESARLREVSMRERRRLLGEKRRMHLS